MSNILNEDVQLRKKRFETMQESMKDIVAEYSDENHGMIILEQHLKIAAEELHKWHSEKARDLSNFIANLELMS